MTTTRLHNRTLLLLLFVISLLLAASIAGATSKKQQKKKKSNAKKYRPLCPELVYHRGLPGSLTSPRMPDPTENELFWEGIVANDNCSTLLGLAPIPRQRIAVCSVATQEIPVLLSKYLAANIHSGVRFDVSVFTDDDGDITSVTCDLSGKT